MQRRARSYCRVAAAVLACGLAAGLPAAPPIETYGQLPTLDHLRLSPAGDRLALISTDPGEKHVTVLRTADLGRVAQIGMGLKKLIEVQWAGTDHLVVVTEDTSLVAGLNLPHQRRWWRPVLIDLASGRISDLLNFDLEIRLPNGSRAIDAIADLPQPRIVRGRAQVFLPGYSAPPGENRFVVTMFKRGVGSGGAAPVVTGSVSTIGMMADSDGRVVAREDYDTETGQWSLWLRGSKGWKRSLNERAELDPPSMEGFGADERSVLVWKLEDGHERFRTVPIETGIPSAPIAAMDDTEVVRDPHRQLTLGGVDSGHLHMSYAFLDPTDQQRWERIERMFAGETVEWVSWSDDRAKAIVHVQGINNGDAFHLVDLASRRSAKIGDEFRGIRPEDYNEVRTLSYPAADGRMIPAFLVLPRGVPAQRLPLVVLVHGGPAAHDKPGFGWQAQAIASLGYAVLQPQYRGSDGFGRAHLEAGYGQWGRKMQTDLSDGLKGLAAEGLIDPARVCIVGDSYGGYAAMAGVTLQSGIYRCAIAVAGVSDLRRLMMQTGTDEGVRSLTTRYWRRFIGATRAGDPVFDAVSPARHADRLSAPLLLIHGDIDTVVQPEQSRIMQTAARRAGKTVQLVTLKGEDHNLSRGATRQKMLRAIADFLRANLPTNAGDAL
jgi:dipeptidyl aminopeptidase/acylaminoacyl peptidase